MYEQIIILSGRGGGSGMACHGRRVVA